MKRKRKKMSKKKNQKKIVSGKRKEKFRSKIDNHEFMFSYLQRHFESN